MTDDLTIYEDGNEIEEWEGEEVEDEAALDAQIASATERLAALRAEAEALIATDSGASTELVPAEKSPQSVKREMAALRATVTKKQDEIKLVAKEIKDLMERKMDAMMAVIAPMQKMVKRLEETIWTVNLYLGRDEEIKVLREGDTCPADEPLVIRQLVLAMDEETAINPEEHGIDARNIEEFDAWILADPAHLDQVLPERKGVVALVPRYRSKHEADPWTQMRMDEANEQTYFLIRNGDALYRIWTAFNVGRHLVPVSDEFSSFFYQDTFSWEKHETFKIPITPGSHAWLKAEESADERRRHYMRVALILQGLIDRTTVFHPLPPEGLSFGDPETYKRDAIKFIYDAEGLLTTGREEFREWQRRLNAQLRPGMRFIGAFNTDDFQHDRYEYNHRHTRISPPGAPFPGSDVLHTIERRDGDKLIFLYERDDKIYHRDYWREPSTPQKRASCWIEPHDRFVIPFDLITEEEIETYLAARGDRSDYVAMFPVLKLALQLKRQEREEEAPFKTMLAGVLARENGVTVEDATAEVEVLVGWWKLANRHHRPLVGSEKDQAKAVRAIVAEHARRIKAAAQGAKSGIVEKLLEAHRNAIMVARRRNGRYVAVVPMNDEDVFVARYDYNAKGEPLGVEEWKLMPTSWISVLVVLKTTTRFDHWKKEASLSEYLTGPEMEEVAETLKTWGVDGKPKGKLEAIAYDPHRRQFYVWRFVKDAVTDEKHPLTGEHKKPEVAETTLRWKRTTGNRVEIFRDGWHASRPNWSGQTRPWIVPQNTHSKGQFYVVLFLDEKIEAQVGAGYERYADIQKRASAMRGIVRSAIESVEQAWEKRTEEAEYADFLEEFLDPELWEGHKKLIRNKLSYPHRHYSHSSWRRGEGDELVQALYFLVEQGIPFAGLTVMETLRTAREHKFLRQPDEWGDKGADAPDDILDLRITLPTGGRARGRRG
jgi:hypothetical protein